VRVPFVDTRFLDVAMRIPARHKMAAKGGGTDQQTSGFSAEVFPGALPKEFLRRQKEQFSDGVGYSWIDSLKAIAETRVTDRDMADAPERFPVSTPFTTESYFYRVDLRRALPASVGGGHRAVLPERRVLVAGRAQVGCGVSEQRGSERQSGERPPGCSVRCDLRRRWTGVGK
jgi:hypothetical protein